MWPTGEASGRLAFSEEMITYQSLGFMGSHRFELSTINKTNMFFIFFVRLSLLSWKNFGVTTKKFESDQPVFITNSVSKQHFYTEAKGNLRN